jgi:hypothetical protein
MRMRRANCRCRQRAASSDSPFHMSPNNDLTVNVIISAIPLLLFLICSTDRDDEGHFNGNTIRFGPSSVPRGCNDK